MFYDIEHIAVIFVERHLLLSVVHVRACLLPIPQHTPRSAVPVQLGMFFLKEMHHTSQVSARDCLELCCEQSMDFKKL